MLKKTFLSLIVLLVMAWPSPSHAYLDPATGSMLIQFLLGGIVAVGVTVKLYWEKVRGLWQKKGLKKYSSE